eukprot:3382819-Pyramimonas_sp.AAC.1
MGLPLGGQATARSQKFWVGNLPQTRQCRSGRARSERGFPPWTRRPPTECPRACRSRRGGDKGCDNSSQRRKTT